MEVPEEHSGAVIQKMGLRRADLIDMRTDNGIVFMEYVISTKNLFGYRSEFVTDTKGLGIMNALFYEYAPDSGYSISREQGSLVSLENGVTNTYSLTNIQDRGILFLGPEAPVYKGQVIGQNARNDDMRVNACKTKHLTNHRSKGEGVSVYFKNA